MKKAFYISLGIFGVTLLLLVSYGVTQAGFLNVNEIALFPGLKEFVSFMDKMSGIDAFLSFWSGLFTIVFGVLKGYFE
jgi:hypothetical protein